MTRDLVRTETGRVRAEGVNDGGHVASSLEMIAAGAGLARLGAAAVLGCGRGAEIPLDLLGGTFAHLDLVDADAEAVAALRARGREGAATDRLCEVHQADLTGLIAQVGPLARDIVVGASEPFGCLDALGRVLTAATPLFWRPPAARAYDFVVCSGVLTQLPATVREHVQRIFLDRFGGCREALARYEPWRRQVWSFTRRLEDLFLAHVAALSAPGGVVYLSDAVHVCWLAQVDDALVTDGPWIATRTARLADYVGPCHQLLAERAWQWLRPDREGPSWGRLYGVQAVLYRIGE